MYSFYPGPSAVSEGLPQYFEEAYREGVMSINHRSPEFVGISSNVIRLLKEKLNVPQDYTVFFTSSATECWEIIAQSVIRESSSHLYNGAFGEKWKSNTAKLGKETFNFEFGLNEEFDFNSYRIPSSSEIICLCQNETSNGTQISTEKIKEIQTAFPESLVAVDATSSMGGIHLPFEVADIWFASVQKCFGLPAGLGLLICSPKAIERALNMKENKHYNSLSFMFEKMQNFQTTTTPNVLGIYLLMRLLEDRRPIEEVEKLVLDRYLAWTEFMEDFEDFAFLVGNPNLRSKTVLPIKVAKGKLELIKSKAKAEGFLLGNGYGKWKDDTFRIANFPSISSLAIEKLQGFLQSNFV